MQRVAVVGNGPSAEGKGEEIDGYDFVVRMRDWWRCAAENAGEKMDAHAYFGWWDDWPDDPRKGFEHWFTQCPMQLEAAGVMGWQRVAFVNKRAEGAPIRWLSDARWNQLRGALNGEHPSTGIVSVAMAIDRFHSTPIELGLYGFDSTTPERPNFFDAREMGKSRHEQYHVTHNILGEKRLLVGLHGGVWITGKSDITLTWPDQPELPCD